ncbi:MAG: phenylalanine--tRNA ligase subunit beta [Opitutales bacterium]|nr:phenylalanine--tRNA ligase subunit beta [Opitutales bacterium]
MKISYNWIKDYIELDRSVEEVEQALTLIGFEVDGIEETGLPDLPKVVVGEVLERNPHPNADRLSVCQVLTEPEGEPSTIVCGADNYKVGDRVPVALPGAVLPGGFKIKSAKLRGVMSSGMMCSAKEIGMGDDAAGLWILDQRPPVGQPLNEVFPDRDTVFQVEVTPNRPDCLSHLGMARELAAYFRIPFSYPEVFPFPESNGSVDPESLLRKVGVESEENCPHYTAWRIANVKIGPSPDWLVRRLRSVGLRPINNIVDVTNFVLHELGQPLHAFDAAKIEGQKLIVRQAGDGEKITTLDGKERTLSSRMMVVADARKALIVAGVMGSLDAEVDESTQNVVLESAYFRPGSIRATSKRLGLSTDSSYRFERGVDPDGVAYAAKRAINLIQEVAGGEILPPYLEEGAAFALEKEINLDRIYLDERAGFVIPDEEVERIFDSLECTVSRKQHRDGREYWQIGIPSFRGDLDSPIDLVEEVVRLYGTDRIPSGEVRGIGLVREDDASSRANHDFGCALAGQGFQECMNYTLRSGDELKKWYSSGGADSLAVMNPLSVEQSHLRWSLIPGLLDVLRLNQFRKTGLHRVFETGHTFYERDGAVIEANSVAFIWFHNDHQQCWREAQAPDFYNAKAIIQGLGRKVGLDLGAFPPGEMRLTNSAWQEGHSATIGDLSEEGFEARFGLLNLALLKEYDLGGIAAAGVFSLTPEFLEKARPRPQFKPISLFPAAERDLALVVPSDDIGIQVRETLKSIVVRETRHAFTVEDVYLFDVYQGQGLEEKEKSLAFSLVFRALDRTLQEKEVNDVFTRVQKAVERETSYRIRR